LSAGGSNVWKLDPSTLDWPRSNSQRSNRGLAAPHRSHWRRRDPVCLGQWIRSIDAACVSPVTDLRRPAAGYTAASTHGAHRHR
jgi:hypothetical protein